MFVAGTALTLLTPDGGWIVLAVLRIVVGIGVGRLNIVSVPYVQEFVPRKQRGFLAGLGSVFIHVGLLIGSLAQKAVGADWRMLVLLGCIPALLLIWLAFVPKSPRFLQSRGREQDARASLAWALQVPVDRVGALPAHQPAAENTTYRVLFSTYLTSLLVVTIGSFSFIMGGFAIQSWGQTLLGEGFGFFADTVANLFIVVSLADLLGRLSAAWLADVIGRRYVMLGYGLLGAAGCFLAVASAGNAWMFFAGITIAMAFGDGAFGVLNPFGAEQFPTSARSTGLGLGYGTGATAKIIGPLIMGAAIGGNIVKQSVTLAVIAPCFAFFGICFLVGAITYLFAKETRDTPLEQV